MPRQLRLQARMYFSSAREMTRLSLDFASAQRSLAGPRPYLGWGILVAGVLVSAITAWSNDQQVEANVALRAERDQLAARLQRSQPAEKVPAELSDQIQQAATAYGEIMTPWDDLFQALEASKGNDVALISITADAAKREFALSGEARDFGALSGFSDALSARPLFPQVALSNHRLSEGAPPIVVKFELRLTWRQDQERRH